MCEKYCLSMGSRSSSLLDLIEKLTSCIPWGNGSSICRGLEISNGSCNFCLHCERKILKTQFKYHCQSCGRLLCGNCVEAFASSIAVSSSRLNMPKEAVYNVKSCKHCQEFSPSCKSFRKCSCKVYPSASLRQSPEPSSPSFSGERFDGHSLHDLAGSSKTSFSNNPSPLSFCCSTSRSDDDDGEESTNHFFSSSSDYFHNASDIDLSSISARNEVYSFTSVGSSPSDSPCTIHCTSNRGGLYVQHERGGTPRSQDEGLFDHERAVLEKPAKGIQDAENVDALSTFQNKREKLPPPLSSESYGLIWSPPPPDDADAEMGNSFSIFDDEDDEVWNSNDMFSPTSSINTMFLSNVEQHIKNKESLKAIVQRNFRALVRQLLQGEDINATEDNFAQWLDIVTPIAWEAANFIKPDTGRGGNMDPCDYVKVKCVASGSRSESKLVKGIVCTMNIKHKRMTSHYRNARLLLLGGALEYHRSPNQLESFNTLLHKESDHLKTIISKIDSHRPNVLLVEKSVSSFSQELLLSKRISLVINVKRPVLERIARCTGATITPSTDHIPRTRLGHCELFQLEKVSENHEAVNQFSKKPSKTLMFFEGCPRRLGCTVVLRGSCREELKKVKQVVQHAVFAAYHLSLETSFLADEGASLPKIAAKSSHFIPEKTTHNMPNSITPESFVTTSYREEFDILNIDIGSVDLSLEPGLQESLSDLGNQSLDDFSAADEFRCRNSLLDACNENLALNATLEDMSLTGLSIGNHTGTELLGQEVELYSNNDSGKGILVSFSSHCLLNGNICERSRLLRVKFYGSSDKPLGRYLRDDLFDKSSLCKACKEPAEAHVIRYTHLHGNLTISIKRLPSVELPGEQDGKIWMWHRCLSCAQIGEIPPATRRVVMSDAAWGLSFGKFLELSFSNHATGNRVASCGHSLQRDCLRFYGLGNMVAFFRHSPINILSVHLPPPVLEFCGPEEQSWIRKEAAEIFSEAESFYLEISGVLQEIKQKSSPFIDELYDASELHSHVSELNNMLAKEKNYCNDLLKFAETKIPEQDEVVVNILEINRLRHFLLVSSRVWHQRLFSLDSRLKRIFILKDQNDAAALVRMKHCSFNHGYHDNMPEHPKLEECPRTSVPLSNEEPDYSLVEPSLRDYYVLHACMQNEGDMVLQDKGNVRNLKFVERLPSAASILSDKIDSSLPGADLLKIDASEAISSAQENKKENPPFQKLMLPSRVYSFDSATMLQERISKQPPSGLHLSAVQSFNASGDYRYMVRDPVSNVLRTYSQKSTREPEIPFFISSVSILPEGARVIVPQNSHNDIFVTIYDNEPTSIISFALSSKAYRNSIADRPSRPSGGSNVCFMNKVNSIASHLPTWHSVDSLDLDYTDNGSYGSEDAPAKVGSLFVDPKSSAHLRISFMDEPLNTWDKRKYSVTCYFAKQFDALRSRCYPSEVDFIRSLSRCKRWSAQGGKSNVYFAKSFDKRFIIKQVTKTELESFGQFSPEYFKYLTGALNSRSPTCLAKVLGIYQVVVKNSKGGKEMNMDLMVMENLFYKRSISKVYDLKGSERSRYISDTNETDKVLLDTNLLETMRTNPIFLGSRAKRILERAIWNDTSFLASADVMDYSLLVGVDEGRKELVVGIIDFMRQYTWDKHLETWVKASGILGGPKNASPTIVSPKQYKKRFRKSMTTYFLTIPDQ